MTFADKNIVGAITGLALMRAPFPAHQVSKLPKPTKKQTEDVRNDFKQGIRCDLCGAWHHKDLVHLDYVGHAALTDRLLECDPSWNWEPVSMDAGGLPMLDAKGGLWIKLTVCNVTRLGYVGDAVMAEFGHTAQNLALKAENGAMGIVHIDSWGSGPFTIRIGRKRYYFSDSDMWGPIFESRDGRILEKQPVSERHVFWGPYYMWRRLGRKSRKVGRYFVCAWRFPRKGLYWKDGRGVSHFLRDQECGAGFLQVPHTRTGEGE
jgi:hypothetical protein